MSEKYREGINRNQQQFFLSSLDEHVGENNQSKNTLIMKKTTQRDLKEVNSNDR